MNSEIKLKAKDVVRYGKINHHLSERSHQGYEFALDGDNKVPYAMGHPFALHDYIFTDEGDDAIKVVSLPIDDKGDTTFINFEWNSGCLKTEVCLDVDGHPEVQYEENQGFSEDDPDLESKVMKEIYFNIFKYR